jgi:hypothetical protein
MMEMWFLCIPISSPIFKKIKIVLILMVKMYVLGKWFFLGKMIVSRQGASLVPA